MYSRKTTPPPTKIIKNGKAQFGTFFPVPKLLDIRGVIAPFAGLSLPSPVTNLRIKGKLSYHFSVGKFIGLVEIFDGKLFALADIIFWDMESGKKFFFHTYMLSVRQLLPIRTDAGVFSNYSHSRYLRIVWNRAKNIVSLKFKMKGNSAYPSVTGNLRSSFDSSALCEYMAVSPAPVTSRCSATWVMSMKAHGEIILHESKKQQGFYTKTVPAFSCFSLNKMFYKFHTKGSSVCGMGTVGHSDVIFKFSNLSSDAVDADKYNDNSMSVDGVSTLMPSVLITHHLGTENIWTIQDTENMIDLTFNPISVSRRAMHIALFRSTDWCVYGTFDGVILSGDGKKIALKNFPGIATSNITRV